MPEYKRPETVADYAHNFEQIKPLMSQNEAHYESARCLFCYDAPCVTACPTGIDIPLFIRQIHTQNTLGAAKTIFDANYLGYSCGKVCPTEVLCEGACVYNLQDVKPIEIGRLQSFATHEAIKTEAHWETPKSDRGRKVAIIGAGPSGISCACELRKEGVEVHIYEAKSKSSGLMAHGIAPYKITNEEVFAEIDYLEKQLGFVVHYDHVIQNKADIQRLETEYDAIFLGIGLGATSSLHIEGETLENCFGAVEFIEKLREQQAEMSVPQTVVVLGGGNTAMDAASECMRMGAENVFLAYRRSKEEMGAYDFEYELAKSVGAKGLFNVAPKAILGHEKVEGISLAKTQSVEGKLVEIPDSAFIMTCDWVIKATGQAKQTSFLALIDGLEVDAKGRIVLHHGQATNLKYFAGGDAANGGKEVVNAVFEGKQAARSILNAWN